MTYLAVDVGSTHLKVVVADRARGHLLTRTSPMPSAGRGLRKGRHESNASGIRDLVLTLISEVLSLHPEIDAMGFSTQMHGIVVTDSENTPLTPFLSWQDERVLERDGEGVALRALLAERIPEELQLRSGVPLRPGIGAGALAHWLRENPLGGGQGARIHTLGSFLIASLTGEYATHITNAAPLGLVDLVRGQWSSELCEIYGFERFALPRIVHSFEQIGVISNEGRPICVYPDIGDQQASILGSGGLSADEVAISLGTAGIIARQVDALVLDSRYENRPYFGGSYLRAISRLPGGRLAETFIRLVASLGREVFGRDLSERQLWDEIYRMLGTTTVGVGGDPQISASEGTISIERMPSEGFDAAALFAALFSSYGASYSQAIEQLFAAEARPTCARLNGGMVTDNEWLRSYLTQALGLDVAVPPVQDLALLGLGTLLATAEAGRRAVSLNTKE